VNPPTLGEREQELFRELREQSKFNPRERLAAGGDPGH
jgi:hypothetical protein